MKQVMETSSNKRKKHDDGFAPTVFEDLRDNIDSIEERASLFHKLNDTLTNSYAQNKAVNDNVHQGYKEAIEINKDNINNALSDLTKKLESLGIQKAENFEKKRHEFLEQIKSVTQNASTLYAGFESLFDMTKKSKESFDTTEYSLRKDLEGIKSKSEEIRTRSEQLQQEINKCGADELTELEQTGVFRDITIAESEQITYENNAESVANEDLENTTKQLESATQQLQNMINDKETIEGDLLNSKELFAKISEQLANEQNLISSLEAEMDAMNRDSNIDTQIKNTEESINIRTNEIENLKLLIAGLKKELEITDNIDIDALTTQLESKYTEFSAAIDVLKLKISEMQVFKERKEEEEKLVLEELRSEERRITQTFSELDTANQEIDRKNEEMVQSLQSLRQEVERLREKKMSLDKTHAQFENSKSSSQRITSTQKNSKVYRTPITFDNKIDKNKRMHNSSGEEEEVSSYVPEIDGVLSFSPKTINKKKQKESKTKKRDVRRGRLSKPMEEKAKESNVSSDHSFSNIAQENAIENRFPHDMYMMSSEILDERESVEMNVSGFDDNANSTIGSMLF